MYTNIGRWPICGNWSSIESPPPPKLRELNRNTILNGNKQKLSREFRISTTCHSSLRLAMSPSGTRVPNSTRSTRAEIRALTCAVETTEPFTGGLSRREGPDAIFVTLVSKSVGSLVPW
jgi:hypothetical protein